MSEPLPDAPSFITRYRWRLRLGTVLGTLVLAATGFTSWYFFVRAPGPRSVCDHVASLRRHFPQQSRSLEEAVRPLSIGGTTPSVDHSSDQLCMWYFTTEHKELGYFSYGRLARCVTSAATPGELFPCL